jgi:hypothetical protein
MKKQKEILIEMMENDEQSGLYEVYGDNLVDEPTINEYIAENSANAESKTPNLKWEEYMHPEFMWSNRKLWINNPKAVNFWLNTKKGSIKDLAKIRNEEENIKTY